MALSMTVSSAAGEKPTEITIETLVIAGWAGRDKDAMEHHIQELEALGVARPKQTPTYYRVSAARLTTAETIEASGKASSGEIEPVVLASDGKLFVGIGSDHTDREAETVGVTISKQMCEKPVSATVWPFEEVAEHWDKLILRSYIVENGARKLYQEGGVASLLHPADTMAKYTGGKQLEDGTALFCGTLPAIGGIRSSDRFEGEIEDPVLGRSITFQYAIKTLPVAD
ncbi:DUF2848 domain-containing protein [Martelella alba]|uniref:DUF2848 domain-containing protein n=1 Tax=Martelella alba TaxID=2590451 RepID=A0A506UAA2_9HYPH|nr:DUF2848 domain-containing protein [Martelella alba]TPW29994.1 DUF2848 domain-containing protein [Martelella alba]